MPDFVQNRDLGDETERQSGPFVTAPIGRIFYSGAEDGDSIRIVAVNPPEETVTYQVVRSGFYFDRQTAPPMT